MVVDSSGNAGASFAAYAARGGLRLTLFVPADASPAKLLQARAHGAVVVSVPGLRAAAGERAATPARGHRPEAASHLWQPAFLAGTATFAYEVFEQLGGKRPMPSSRLGRRHAALGHASASAGSGQRGHDRSDPRLIGVQSDLCAPLAHAFRAGEPSVAT
jgi:threonine synthase